MSKWTIARVKDALSQKVRIYHEAYFPEERRSVFYRRVAEMQTLIQAEGWRLEPPKLNRTLCSFYLMDRVTRVKRPFGITLQPYLPYAEPIDRNGEKIRDHALQSNPPRIFARITEEEARHLERQHGCQFWCIDQDLTYYDIPDKVSELLPMLEYTYKKLSGN